MIYQLLKPSSIAMGGLGVVLSVTITDLCIILVYITSADMPIQQVLAVILCIWKEKWIDLTVIMYGILTNIGSTSTRENPLDLKLEYGIKCRL